MDESAEVLRLRERADDDTRERAGLEGVATRGSFVFAGRTKTVTTYPTSANRFYAVAPLIVTGAESEGSTGTLTASNATVYAYNIGSTIPASGSDIIVVAVDERYVFKYDS